MNRNQLDMLKELQALEFAAFDFVLYLDTHPGDQRALMEYCRLTREAQQMQKMYEANYGPLTAEASTNNQGCWRWIEEPWPWQIDYQ